jgi:poly-gamma-glutamate capsule biosynthesis protein CapA/YwtB (metallophosphatase superfamily)
MRRRDVLLHGGYGVLAGLAAPFVTQAVGVGSSHVPGPEMPPDDTRRLTLFLCGDVMTGRGIDQILPYPVAPQLHEPYVHSALEYVELAERVHGRIERPVRFDYVWGDALAELAQLRPTARIVNLESAVTTSDEAWPDKGIHYRMNPRNVACLTAARLDCCVLANNHVLDWGRGGLTETLATLRAAGIATAGAGADEAEAARPAALEVGGRGRLLVFAYGMASSGILNDWAATPGRAGVNLLTGLSARNVDAIARHVGAHRRSGDVVVLSLHWGSNWGYRVSGDEQAFARSLIDGAGVDLVHGHSSHHVKGIEVHAGKLILYGCGDLLTDYEGIGGYEDFRGDLSLMYFPTLDTANGRLVDLTLTPTQLRRFRITLAPQEGLRWLEAVLNREGRAFGSRVEPAGHGRLALRWG